MSITPRQRGIFALLLVLPAAIQAPAARAVQVQSGATLSHDDNVWRLSDEDLALFRAKPDDPLFTGIAATADWILAPFLFVSNDPRGRPRPARYSLELSGELYAQNDVLNSIAARVAARVPIGRRSTLALYLNHRPNLYVGETRRTPDQVNPQEEFVTRNTAGFHFYNRHSKRWRSRWSGSISFDDYTAGFDDQDSVRYRVGVRADYRPTPRLRLRARYRYEYRRSGKRLEDVSGGTTSPAGGPLQVVTNDISSTRDTWQLGASGRLTKALTAFARYRLDRKRYTTDSPADPNHFRRHDTTRWTTLGVRYRYGARWSFALSTSRTVRDSSADPTIYDYTDRTTGLDVSYRF